MRIQHKMTCQPSYTISPVTVRGVREGKGGGRREEGGGRRAEKRKGREGRQKKNAETGNKSNINLKVFNFRYHRNYFRDFSNKLQINAAKSISDQISSDKAPFNYILKIMLNKKSKIRNTNELLDALLLLLLMNYYYLVTVLCP